jgi:hypothetical protein
VPDCFDQVVLKRPVYRGVAQQVVNLVTIDPALFAYLLDSSLEDHSFARTFGNEIPNTAP